MGSIGMMELFIILLGIIIPIIILIIVYRIGKKSGENKILRQFEEERRKNR